MRAKPVVDCYLFITLCLHFVFCNCYPFHCIEFPNTRLGHFVEWFTIWPSLIVITVEGSNPETGWLRSYLA